MIDLRMPFTKKRRASILLLVLIVVAALSLCTSSYLLLMENEHRATRFHGRRAQASSAASSGMIYVQAYLTQPALDIAQQGGLFDNPTAFLGIPLDENAEDQDAPWQMTIVAPQVQNGYYSGVRYGLENESAKLHLNSLLASDASEQRLRLLSLPSMTNELADAILDWLDADDLPRDFGAESEYYQQLDPPLKPRNGPIDRLDELLAVRGMTPEMLYGIDQNRNYLVDANESASGVLTTLDNTLGQLNLGLAAYLTVVSAENLTKSVTGALDPLIDLNNPDLQTLQTSLQSNLSQDQAQFIILYRQYGAQSNSNSVNSNNGNSGQGGNSGSNGQANGGSSSTPVNPSDVELDLTKQGGNQINSLLDLVGVTISVPNNQGQGQSQGQQGQGGGGGRGGGGRGGGSSGGGGNSQGGQNSSAQIVASPWQDDPASYRQLATLYDTAAAGAGPVIAGRVNINEATRPVLLTIPGMTAQTADQIILRREAEIDRTTSEQRHPLWLLINGIVSLNQMRTLERFITTRGCVYSGQSIGFQVFNAAGSGNSRENSVEIGSVARQAFRLDTRGTKPEWVAWENLSRLGRGFSAETLLGEVESSP